MNIAQAVINDHKREDFENLAGGNQSVSDLLKQMSKLSENKKISFQHILSHKSLPGQFSTLNALADSLCKREPDIAFEPLTESEDTENEVRKITLYITRTTPY